MNKPSGKGLKRAMKKLLRLTSRGARRRRLERLSSRCGGLARDYQNRLVLWRESKA